MRKIEIKPHTRVELSSHELLFLAKSGQPYRGSLYVAFDSVGESFDMLDFKRYLTSLRSATLYGEDIAFVIYTEINRAIESQNLGVVVELAARGGIRQRLEFGAAFEPHKSNNIFQVG
jgi:NADPH-dependent 7-cyano-7-deazaguanine reductase QueF